MVRARNGERAPLERPWTRRALIRELATLTGTQASLAEKYGVGPPSITEFKQRHAHEIEQVRAEADNEFAGLLLAQKEARIASYQDLLEEAFDEHDRAAAIRILRNIAEEMGHLPSRVTLAGELGITTRYTIDGVEPGALT